MSSGDNIAFSLKRNIRDDSGANVSGDGYGSNSGVASGSGGVTPAKQRKTEKTEEKNTKDAIVDNMFDSLGSFDGMFLRINSKKYSDVENQGKKCKQILRLYKAAKKAKGLLETEYNDLSEALELPIVQQSIQTSNDNAKVWSDLLFTNPSPIKKKGVKTVPSLTTERLGGMLHSVAAFVGLTAEATCSNKRKQDNIENMNHLLETAKTAIEKLSSLSADMEKSIISAYAQLTVTAGMVIPDGANTEEPSSNDANVN